MARSSAKTLGGILHADMTMEKWKNILNNELWLIDQKEGDILIFYQHSE
jgi:hypothetical protein